MRRRGEGLAALAATLLLTMTAGCASGRARLAPEPSQVDARFGVRLETLRVSAAGTMLDLRYRVTDPARAKRIIHRAMEPYVREPQGGVLTVPRMAKVGALRQAPAALEADRVYFILFANPGRRVKPGDRVEVVIGELTQTVVVN